MGGRPVNLKVWPASGGQQKGENSREWDGLVGCMLEDQLCPCVFVGVTSLLNFRFHYPSWRSTAVTVALHYQQLICTWIRSLRPFHWGGPPRPANMKLWSFAACEIVSIYIDTSYSYRIHSSVFWFPVKLQVAAIRHFWASMTFLKAYLSLGHQHWPSWIMFLPNMICWWKLNHVW